MLAMGEEGLLWDDEPSWAFPKLEEDCGTKSADISNSDGQLAAKDKEARPPPEKSKKRSAAAAGESEDHELHIWTERERRKKMRNMFSNLHALLPHIPPKADKSTIVDEAVKYIKKLQHSKQELEKRKVMNMSEREAAYLGPVIFKTWSSPNVILNVCGRDAQISVCTNRKPSLFTALCFIMDNNNLEVVSAHTSSDRAICFYMIHARAYGDQFQQAFPIEQIFKQAAAEIMIWLTS